MELRPLQLFAGLNAEELWPTNNVVLFTWFLLFFLPFWKWTPTLTLIAPILNSIVYTGTLLSLLLWPKEDVAPIDFSTLQGVVEMFKDPTGVFAGWVHYVVFDALVGRMMVLDSIRRGNCSIAVHIFVMIPCLFFTIMVGPMGFLSYMFLRQIFLPISESDDSLVRNNGDMKTIKIL